MRRIVVAVMGTISALVLLFSYHTSTRSGMPSVAAPSVAAAPPDPSAGSSSTSSPSTSSPSTSSSSGTSSYTGDAVDTRWGPVQVRITVQGGRITAAEAVQYPQNNPRDQEINAYAVPLLNQEAVQEQGGAIDAVSGATVTSDGYIQSLQSAIDQAHL